MAGDVARQSYVYVIFRRDGVPCYVGKGIRTRWRDHARHTHNRRLKELFDTAGGDLPIVIIRHRLTDKEACEIERAFIAAIGRRYYGGPLLNETDGGDGTRGYKQPPHVRQMHAEVLERARKTEQFRETHAAASKAKIGRRLDPEYLAARKAAGRSAAWIEGCKKQAETKRGRRHTEETKQKIAAALRGKPKSTEARRKLSVWHTGRPLSDAHRLAMSIAKKGKPSGRKGIPLSDAHKMAVRQGIARRKIQNDVGAGSDHSAI